MSNKIDEYIEKLYHYQEKNISTELTFQAGLLTGLSLIADQLHSIEDSLEYLNDIKEAVHDVADNVESR